jgi:molybdopterin-binding protein
VIKGIEKGEVAATVKIEITGPATITSMITKKIRHSGAQAKRKGERAHRA